MTSWHCSHSHVKHSYPWSRLWLTSVHACRPSKGRHVQKSTEPSSRLFPWENVLYYHRLVWNIVRHTCAMQLFVGFLCLGLMGCGWNGLSGADAWLFEFNVRNSHHVGKTWWGDQCKAFATVIYYLWRLTRSATKKRITKVVEIRRASYFFNEERMECL